MDEHVHHAADDAEPEDRDLARQWTTWGEGARWYFRPDGERGYVSYQGAELDSPVYWALEEAANLVSEGRDCGLPEGMSGDDVRAYVAMMRGFTGQEKLVTHRQAAEFARIVRSLRDQHWDELIAMTQWAVAASLEVLPHEGESEAQDG
ncbi:hypothetical protein KBZ00_25925 [Streptomyces sp. RK31]|uniref:hypothetical protein n=1 Tax=Streptomyces sp. RK31 TaxID=2824892 RepID=UPI001B37982B|nr:hypothetical protein [Streptomyces sp. RK31]MBQ0974539.1 hypothetical protein [Streptomyces sp. RK31]